MGIYYAWASPAQREYFVLPDENQKYPVGDSTIVVFEWLRDRRWDFAVVCNDASDYPWQVDPSGWKNVTADALDCLADLADERSRDLLARADSCREAFR